MPPGVAPEGCEIILLSPFEIHFSQTRIRDQFQDSRTVEDAIASVTWEASKGEYDDESERGGKDAQVAEHPFPRIEVTRWRCKLREADGSPKVDSAGMELYSHDERWFTFDNRRLYCLQQAATTRWPNEVRCEVVAVPGELAKTRELRKFDTRTFGNTVIVGKKDDSKEDRRGAVGDTWSWRAAVGVPEEQQPEDGIARRPSTRYRGRDRRDGSGPGSGRRRQEDEADESNGTNELIRSALLFFLLYLVLRIIVSVFRQRFMKTGGETTTTTVIPT